MVACESGKSDIVPLYNGLYSSKAPDFTSETDELKKAINLQRRNQKLSKEDKKIIQTAQKSANLVLNYGKKALILLAARGIGPTTTTRILQKNFDSKDEDELFLDILEAERRFERTRQFWDKK